MSKQIVRLNATGLKTTTCMQNFWNVLIEGYKTERKIARIVYGIAGHKFIDTMFQTKGNLGLARTAALAEFNKPKFPDDKQKHLNDANHFIVNCFNYWNEYLMKDEKCDTVLMPNNTPATELTFRIPYYEDDYIIVTLEGTIDRLIKIRGGRFAVNDFKFTSSWNKDEYLANYSMSQQLRFYVLALKIMGEMYPASMLGQIGITNVGAVVDGIFLKPNSADTEYQRSDVFPFKDLVDFRRSLDLLIQRISRTVEAVKVSNIPAPKEGILNGSCESKWGKCGFWNVCRVADKAVEQVLLKRDFIKKEYDPLHHNDDI